MPQTEDWTLGRLLTWTQDYLRGRGIENPRLDAEVLLAKAQGCPRIALYTSFDQPAQANVRETFRALVKRRAEGTPVAYLVGQREFFSLAFQVTPDVLIPRPETEFLVIAVLDLVKTRRQAGPLAIADIGTGSGAVGICLARHLPQAEVTATDVSQAALRIAEANARTHQVAGRMQFLAGDLLAPLPAAARWDYIVSNPPYVRSDEMADLPRDVRDYEPRLALDGGPEGLDVIGRLIPAAAERLAPGGVLAVEIGPRLEERARALLAADGRFAPPRTVRDLAKLPRVVVAERRSET